MNKYIVATAKARNIYIYSTHKAKYPYCGWCNGWHYGLKCIGLKYE